MIAFRRHLDEATLAEIADLGTHDHLTSADRLHLDSCDRCRELVTGHQRASRLLSAGWRLVPAAEVAAAGAMAVRPRLGVGSALRPADARARTSWLRLAVVLGAALLLVVAGLLIASSRPPLPTSTRITFEASDESGAPNRRLLSVNTDGSAVESVVPGEGWEWIEDPAWSPDGRQLAFERWGPNQSQLVIVAAGSTGEPRILDEIRPLVGEGGFDWSPDGRSLAGSDERGLVVVDAESGERRLTVWRSVDERGPVSWSPDGSRILYAAPPSYVSGRLAGDVVVVNVASGQKRSVYHADRLNCVYVSPDAWSRDGSRFVFYAQRGCGEDLDADGVPRILVMDEDWSQPRELAAGKDPTWSPDGSLIAFEAPYEAVTGFLPGIWVIQPDGSGLRFIGAEGVRPRWSPDGRQIAYCGHEHDEPDGRVGFFVADVTGGVQRLVYPDGCLYYGELDWRPTPPGD